MTTTIARSSRGLHQQLGRSLAVYPLLNCRLPVSTYSTRSVEYDHKTKAQPEERTIDKAIRPSSSSTVESKRPPFWQQIPRWNDVGESDFLKYSWQIRNIVQGKDKLLGFLSEVLPNHIPPSADASSELNHIKTRDDFLRNVEEGIQVAPMAVRLTPYILSSADWSNPLQDPVRRQFIPLRSGLVKDHPSLGLDSLREAHDSPVEGLVHRYPDKVLFLATSICPVYCRFCTRSYAVGDSTASVHKMTKKPSRRRWEAMFEYIERTPEVQDIVVSGGDSYYLHADHLLLIGERLLSMPNIKRIRFATKGLAVCPSRIIDPSDGWTEALISLSNQSRSIGKQVAIHTHFNHPNEITWITEIAARYLFQRGVIVRNQTVLLRGINDDVNTMSTLIRQLADFNIQPYYVYQSDMVSGVEDLRTPLSTILDLEKKIRGTIAGFMMPSFIVDLPGGGGKRLAHSYETYSLETGVSIWKAPGVAGDETFEYHDPIQNCNPPEVGIDRLRQNWPGKQHSG